MFSRLALPYCCMIHLITRGLGSAEQKYKCNTAFDGSVHVFMDERLMLVTAQDVNINDVLLS